MPHTLREVCVHVAPLGDPPTLDNTYNNNNPRASFSVTLSQHFPDNFQFAAMKFRPTSDELSRARRHGDRISTTNLMEQSLSVSGSRWSRKHLTAFKAVSFDYLEPNRLIPERFIPSDNCTGFLELAKQLSKPSREELRKWSLSTMDKYEDNKFYGVFENLHEAMLHDDQMQSLGQAPTASSGPSQPSSGSPAPSHSSQEDKPESSSRDTLERLMRRLAKELSRTGAEYMLKSFSADMPLKIKLGADSNQSEWKDAINDGGWLLRKTDGSYQGNAPLVAYETIQAKRRNANHSVRHTGQEEKFQENILAQELAELLAIALENHNPGGGGQETYVASIHGTQVRLVAAMFSQAYLEAVRSGTMPEKQEQNIRRSKFFELKTPGGRKEALRMLYGLGQYILSGQAEVEQVRIRCGDLAKDYRPEPSTKKRKRKNLD